MAAVDPASTPGFKGGDKKALREVKKHRNELFELHERLYAERKRSLLVILQGMDTSGKDGTVTHVVRNFNPQGVLITPFKAPTQEERRRGFLWRIRRRLPDPGFIGIFNRSHYADVLVARVHDLVLPTVIERRYGLINAVEKAHFPDGTSTFKRCLRRTPPHPWGGVFPAFAPLTLTLSLKGEREHKKSPSLAARAFWLSKLRLCGRSWRAGPSGSTRFRTKPSRHPGGRRSRLRCHCGGRSIPVRPRP